MARVEGRLSIKKETRRKVSGMVWHETGTVKEE